MRFSFLLIMLVAGTYVSGFSQLIKRNAGEPIDSFLIRNTPAGLSYREELQSQMFEINDAAFPGSIIGFYNYNYKLKADGEEYTDVIGYLFVPSGSDLNTYSRILMDTFETEGTTPEIIAIFFANADRDKEKEMVVMIRWLVRHYRIQGDLYETRIYDNFDSAKLRPAKLKYLKAVSEKVSGTFDGYRDEEHVISKFKTAREVRVRLKQLGYR